MEDVSFSVVMPLYAGSAAEALQLSLASLVDQHHLPDEIVVVRDGPLTEAHDRVLAEFAERAPQLHVVPLPERGGIAGAINAGMHAAGHPWIARMDADDLALPTRFGRQVELLRTGRHDALGAAMAEFVDSPENIVGTRRMPESHDEIARAMRRYNPMNHPTMMFRRDLALSVGGFVKIPSVVDYDFFARMLAAGGRFHNLPSTEVLFRAGDDMLLRRKNAGSVRIEVELQRRLHAYGLVTWPRAAANVVARNAFRMLPLPVVRWAYRRLFYRD